MQFDPRRDYLWQTDSKKEQWNYGVNYYIAPRVVLKLDIQEQALPTAGLDEDGFAIAVGYSF